MPRASYGLNMMPSIAALSADVAAVKSVVDSVMEETEILDDHVHSAPQVYGAASASDLSMTRGSVLPIQVLSGANAFGTEHQLTNGATIESGNPLYYFDMNMLVVVAVTKADAPTLLEIFKVDVGSQVDCTFDTAGEAVNTVATHGLENGNQVVFDAVGAGAEAPTIGNTPDGKPSKVLTIANGKLNVTGLSFTDTTKISWLCWVRPTDGTYNRDQYLYIPNTNYGNLHLKGNATNVQVYPLNGDQYDATLTMAVNTWHFLAITTDAGTAKEMKFSINGGTQSVKTTSMTNIAHTSAKIGNDAGSSIAASIADVMIFNRILSATEITAIYNASKIRYGL